MPEADAVSYRVVVNDEAQYSIWPLGRDVPRGWRETEMQGGRDDCLTYIKRVWTDMRPASLRRQMDGAGDGHAPRG
jgi:MbtH protein